MSEQLIQVLGRQYEVLCSRSSGWGWSRADDAIEAFCDRVEALYGFRPNHNFSDWRRAWRHRIVDDAMVNP